MLVYFEDFDHPTETQMLHTPLLLGALAIFVYRIMSSQCSKASKATEFPFESYGCDAKLSGGAEEIASSSDFSFLRFFGVKLYDVIKRGGVGLQMRFTTFQCTTYTPTNHSLSKVPNKCTSWKTSFHMAGQEGQFDVVKFMSSTNLNDQHVNGMTHFDDYGS